MGSKIFLYPGVLLALVLLISSDVAARDVASTNEKKAADNVDDAKYPGYYGDRDHGNYPGRGGGRSRGYPPRGPRCYHGCCRRSNYGPECLRCCSYAGEAVDAQAEQAKPHN